MIARSNKKGDKKKEDIKLNNVYIKFIMRTHASFIKVKTLFLGFIYMIYIFQTMCLLRAFVLRDDAVLNPSARIYTTTITNMHANLSIAAVAAASMCIYIYINHNE